MRNSINKLTELDRRNFLTGAAASTLGVSILPGIAGAAENEVINPASHATAKNVIFLYMSGGMTHVDTFDPKTTSGIAGPSQPVATNADGVQISNLLGPVALGEGRDGDDDLVHTLDGLDHVDDFLSLVHA